MTGESADGRIRVLLVEDHAAFRQALAFVLDRQPGFRVVAQVGTLAAAREAIGEGIDAALVDLMLPDGNGADLISELHQANPSIKVLVLSASLGEENLTRAREAGADGVLDKTISPAEIARTLRRMRTG